MTFGAFIRFAVAAAVCVALRAPGSSQTPGDILFRPVTGPIKILIIRVSYPDDPSNPISPGAVSEIANQLKRALQLFSYGRVTSVQVDVAGVPTPLQLPHPKSYYSPPNPTAARLREDAVRAAEQAGFPNVQQNYDREFIASTKVWGGAANVGNLNQRTAFCSTAQGSVWAHELGHTHDWMHANQWRVFVPENGPESAGTSVEYGDIFDTMGNFSEWHHHHPWLKYRVSWLQGSEVQLVTGPGTYTLQAIENPPSPQIPTALRIRRDTLRDYWIYHRATEPGVNNGVLIGWGYRSNVYRTDLLDLNPFTSSLLDAALPKNQTYTTPLGFSVRTDEADPQQGIAKVTIIGSVPTFDVLPVIDVTQPARGLTLRGTVTFTVTAYDPDVGTKNGDGILRVRMGLWQDKDGVVNWLTKGAEMPPPILLSPALLAPPYQWTVDTTALVEASYVLVVQAESVTPVGALNRIWFLHLVDNR